MNKINKIEILAPAGNEESFYTAIKSGANAIYIGLSEFSARAKSNNFDILTIDEHIKNAHLFDIKVYVAINTLLKDNEIDRAIELIKKADLAGADAFIIQDLGLLKAIKENNLNIEVHASTQMGIHNLEGAIVAEKLGFSRVVLSRETTIEDIINIKQNTNLEIEYFVQGALCVSFSGNCYISSLITQNSGNRGKCLQFCRKKYTAIANNKKFSGYYLSPADLCHIENVKKLVDAGVDSFKIEGRMRSKEYVYSAVIAYKNAISNASTSTDLPNLKVSFNRGDYTNAHLLKCTNNIIYKEINSNIGHKIGIVERVKNGVAKLKLQKVLNTGDGIKFIRDKKESATALVSVNGSSTTFKGDVKAGDAVHLTNSITLKHDVEKLTRFLNVNCRVEINRNKKIFLSFMYKEIEVSGYSDFIVEESINSPLSEERLKDMIINCGEEFLKIDDIIVSLDKNCYVPVSTIKNLRRELISKLKIKILEEYKRKNKVRSIINNDGIYFEYNNSFKLYKNKIFIQIENINQINDFIKKSDYIIFRPQIYSLEKTNEFYDLVKEKAILSLPLIARHNDIKILKEIINNSKINNYIVNNIYGIELTKTKNIIFGYGMNLLNSKLNVTKINSIESEKINKNSINYLYGFFPLMTFCHCVSHSLDIDCTKECFNNDINLIDDKNNNFVVRKYKIENCYNELLNSTPINYLSVLEKYDNISYMIDFCNHKNNDVKIKNFQTFKGNYNKKLL